MKISIKASDRILVCGKTGCGKSVLVNQLIIPNLNNYVIYDRKHEIEIDEAVIFTKIADFKTDKIYGGIIYRPKVADDREFNMLCKIVFNRGNCTLVLDEVADHTTSTKITQYHDLIMRLGRSRGVGIINCTQRPVGISNNILSQCEHFFILALLALCSDKKTGHIHP